MNKAIVFGSSGLVGSELVRFLIDDPYYDKIVLFNRSSLSLNSPKIEEYIIDFDELKDFPDEITSGVVFCTIGTTIKKAKSVENFVKIDFDIPYKIAEIAKNKEIDSFLIVSSIGANAYSKNYYTKTKGLLEEELQKYEFLNLKILRPSLLLGQRKEFRFFELISKIILPVLGLFLFGRLKKYRAIQAKDVAKAMIWLSKNKAKKTIFESDEIKQIARK
jgi:nucleoside-diphosphate-sugar epimerase